MNVIVGGSGLLGGMVTRQLLARGQAVRVLARGAPVYDELGRLGAVCVNGDLKDRASLQLLCKGARTVIATASASQRTGTDSADTLDNVDLWGIIGLIDEARNAGARQFIYVSAWGAKLGSSVPLLRIKAQVEHYLQRSGLTYTILQPEPFLEVWAGAVIGAALQHKQPVSLVGQGEKPHRFVPVEDVAAWILASVGNFATMNRSLPIGGAQVVTWAELVRMVSDVLGAPIPVQHVPPDAPIEGMPDTVTKLLNRLETLEPSADMTNWIMRLGIQQMPLETALRQMFAPEPA